MRRAVRNAHRAAFCLAALSIALPCALAAQDPEGWVVKEKAVRCEEGDDCTKRSHRVIVTPGRRVEILENGDGEPLVWLGRPGKLALEALDGLQWMRGAFLGVQLTDLTPELRRHFGVPEDQGVLVASVTPDSAAERAGVQVGDILTGIEGESVSSASELARSIGSRDPGAIVQLELFRDGRLETLTATLDEPTELPKRAARVFFRCDGGECEGSEHPKALFLNGADLAKTFDCAVGDDGDEVECAIEVRCEDGTCTCKVDGEERECEQIEGFPSFGLMRRHQEQ